MQNRLTANILSDLHIDFYVSPNATLDDMKRTAERIYKSTLINPGDILLVAGDISHNNNDILMLEAIRQVYGFSDVLFTLGNHDLYVDSKSKFSTSKARVLDWKKRAKQMEHVHLLDGDVISIKGVRIGGAMGFYDGTYNAPPHISTISLWRRMMTDSGYMKGYDDFYDIFMEEKPKLIAAASNCDIMMSHVCPVSERKAFIPEYQDETSSMFYAFDGSFIKSKPPIWFYGHTHGTHVFKHEGTHYYMNSFGYPSESRHSQAHLFDLSASVVCKTLMRTI